MISLDQILLLQEKVENAVAVIAQLKAENDALRRKCTELTNSLSAKTEQFSSFQDKIEEGILRALNRLDAVERKVLEGGLPAGSVQKPDVSSASGPAPVVQNESTEVNTNPVIENQVSAIKEEVNAETENLQSPEPETVQVKVSQTETPSDNTEPAVQFDTSVQAEIEKAPEAAVSLSESIQPPEADTFNSSETSAQPLFDIF